MRICLFMILAIAMTPMIHAQDTTDKQQTLTQLRETFAQSTYRAHKRSVKRSVDQCLALLTEQGQFRDLVADEQQMLADNDHLSPYHSKQNPLGKLITQAMNRIWLMAETYRGQSLQVDDPQFKKICLAIDHYGKIELSRADGPFRFHDSCFAIPLAAVNLYFCFFETMDALPAATNTASYLTDAHQTLKQLAMQAWTQPKRNDPTDENPISAERFSQHVLWVGGNALAFRPVYPSAVMFNDPHMMDVIAEVAHRGIDTVSYNTQEQAFWEENLTVDGAAWGHGRQMQLYGYPMHGLSHALKVLEQLHGTPWHRPLTEQQVNDIFNYLRGSTWFWLNGYRPPITSRYDMLYNNINTPSDLKSLTVAGQLLEHFSESLSADQITELNWLISHAVPGKDLIDNDQYAKAYKGNRYFWNNDALVHKTAAGYMAIKMCSSRVDGLESVANGAARYNFFTVDGSTFFMHHGNEYAQAMGGWDLTSIPGVTCRNTPDLTPVTHWRGYNNELDFAGGIASPSWACAGFIFEKNNPKYDEYEDNDASGKEKNPGIFDVRAYKSYFLFGDTLLALGAGITNLKPQLPGNIRTTIDQTLWLTDIQTGQAQTLADKLQAYVQTIPAGQTLSHGKTHYTLLSGHSMHLAAENRTTQWNELARNNRKVKTPNHVDILQLYIDHGPNPQDASYSYTVHMGDLKKTAKPNVISNTTKLQAAESKDGRNLMAVIYDPTQIIQGSKWMIQSNTAVVVALDAREDKPVITVSDPTQSPKLTSVQILFARASSQPNWQAITIDLPTGKHAGKQVSCTPAITD